MQCNIILLDWKLFNIDLSPQELLTHSSDRPERQQLKEALEAMQVCAACCACLCMYVCMQCYIKMLQRSKL